EELLVRLHRTTLRPAQDPRVLELRTDRGLEPAQRVDVPKTPDALLELGLQERRHRPEPIAPSLAVRRQPLGERAGVVASERQERGAHLVPRRRGPRKYPAVEHGSGRVEPFGRDLGAGVRRSDGVTDAETG